MNRLETFTFRVNSDDRQLLASIALHYRRSKSDVVRFLLHEKAQELGLQINLSDSSSETPLGPECKLK